MTRDEHLAWAKENASLYLDRGDWQEAWAVFAQDLDRHPELRTHAGLSLGLRLLFADLLSSSHAMRVFINGFH